jgi:hypothetical protein
MGLLLPVLLLLRLLLEFVARRAVGVVCFR